MTHHRVNSDIQFFLHFLMIFENECYYLGKLGQYKLGMYFENVFKILIRWPMGTFIFLMMGRWS